MKHAIRLCGAALGLSLLTTLALLVLEGRWREAIPLHLCSVSALAALALAFGKWQGLLDFLWYLGMPGAALALVFPAPAVSRWQGLLNASYVLTHALILAIPALRMAGGMRPESGREAAMFLAIQGLAGAALLTNFFLGTDFLFLSAPPAGTPLEAVSGWGALPYVLALEGMMLLLIRLTGALLRRIGGRTP